MHGTKWIVAGVAVSAVSVGVAVGASRSSETTPVTADFHAALTSQHQRVCGENHMKFRLRFEGSQTSSDPRLVGDLEARVRSVLDTQNGYGWTSGTVVIRDPATGRLKFHGHVVGVLEPDGGTEGFLTGHTVGKSSVRLLANFNVQQDATGAITGALGTDTQSGTLTDSAILTDACRGGHNKRDDRGHSHRHGPPLAHTRGNPR
jgi:hypothetical protein